MTLTHQDLCHRAVRWLRGTKAKSKVVISELVCGSCREVPDAIGFNGHFTTLIECKTSRSDFHRDKKKRFRQDSKLGMGFKRYYLVPAGLIDPEDLPDQRWGLLYCYDKSIRMVKESSRFLKRNQSAELNLVLSCMRRTEYPKTAEVFIDKFPIE